MAAAEQSEYAKRIFRNELNGSDAYTRHKKLINDYILFYGRDPSKSSSEIADTVKTELDVLKENHKFIRDPDEDESSATWEQRVAKKYYNKLFKEYAICELKYYKEGKVGVAWSFGNLELGEHFFGRSLNKATYYSLRPSLHHSVPLRSRCVGERRKRSSLEKVILPAPRRGVRKRLHSEVGR
ncbi:folate-sensitive fragile site protein Fra10Ac1-domain-containing protein [Endogone sp. FLAS-F59071]|nr:folate-sensitive fragile site protein Fra10Ac1-domain-containing protein [Endogone sp. FLAS-F59071]|eukprot:RUS15858.1 folate-sensitive fragile site protein Fra10Ac1-domain-containing protein [Endogone sp. FLAS-F59071]